VLEHRQERLPSVAGEPVAEFRRHGVAVVVFVEQLQGDQGVEQHRRCPQVGAETGGDLFGRREGGDSPRLFAGQLIEN
jgi:hypothetical protein